MGFINLTLISPNYKMSILPIGEELLGQLYAGWGDDK